MRTIRQSGGAEEIPVLDDADTRVLGTGEERELLKDLAECKQKLAKALAQIDGVDLPRGADDPQALAHFIASGHANDVVNQARLGAVFHRYSELRGKLALANMRLVAHVAKRFRDRGVAYSDLIQEGFCGLLEAIDRFDLTHQTKLATYATWWIRQAMQRSVASGAYPVRLSPRHLRQLAQSQEEAESAGGARAKRPGAESLGGSPEMIRRIQAATRPTVSLDATLETASNFNLLQIMSDPEGNRTEEVDMDETVGRLMDELRPREQQVLSLRFGLSGEPRLSLSQVGKVLAVSKERVRQIQDRALEKLRAVVKEDSLPHALIMEA